LLSYVFEVNGRAGVEDLVFGLALGCEPELGKIFETTKEDWVEGVMEGFAVEGLDDSGVAVDVVLVVPAEETGTVPGEAAGPGLEEEAAALDASERESEASSLEEGFDSGECAAAESGSDRGFGNQLDRIRVQPEVKIRMSGESFAVETGEVRLRAPAGEIALEFGRLREGQTEIAPDGSVVTLDIREPFKTEGALIERNEGRFGDRPAAARHMSARSEVEGAEL
jgi:hypothetical protein